MTAKHKKLIALWEKLYKGLCKADWKEKGKRLDRLTRDFIEFEREFLKAV